MEVEPNTIFSGGQKSKEKTVSFQFNNTNQDTTEVRHSHRVELNKKVISIVP